MQLIGYTRVPEDDEIYSAKLAYSMHLALVEGQQVIPLNYNSGILYAKATQNPDRTLHAKSLKNPWIFMTKEGEYGVLAVRTETDGSVDKEGAGKLLLFHSKDLIVYEELALFDLGRGKAIRRAVCCYAKSEGKYRLMWQEESGETFVASVAELAENEVVKNTHPLESKEWENATTFAFPLSVWNGLPKGAVPGNALEIPEKTAERLKIRFLTPYNIANEVPTGICAASAKELQAVKATARYSDGSSVEKPVDWNVGMVNWDVPGEYAVTGRVHQNRYEFPVAWHRADPCVGKWNGKYYFIATNDLDNNHSISIREADTIAGLVTAQEIRILDTHTYPHLGNLLWAPEFHIIRGKLYIFHAGTPGEFGKEQCHVMALKEGGDPKNAGDWEMPVRVLNKDGSPLYGEEGITLDMTEFEVNGECYVCWSQRQFKPVDLGAWLYMAKINPDEPWKLITAPVLLSMPEYGWANNHTFVDEGPFALIRDGKVYLTFSSAAVDSTYVVGMLSADITADLLNPDSWQKENYPLMTSRSAEGEFGTGHNAYVTDEDGLVWNTYHAKPGVHGPRSSGIRRVHFNVEGFPVLGMTEEMDLKPELALVKTKVTVVK